MSLHLSKCQIVGNLMSRLKSLTVPNRAVKLGQHLWPYHKRLKKDSVTMSVVSQILLLLLYLAPEF